ncbi:TadE family type IV pilus minor pilin [Streptomyces spiramenti]|uniref:Pilus assembly protein TadE n=1 Tax=Streptomyces spiramenti TaxID=2720606 RepID=A0ABX1ASR3_9ACTN|nr:TadE family type IV pilus minor pilin [Streptomyces spiramenti]NJP67457.1 hypothetical protein [Streptomyces spiramenti]
MLRCDGVAEAGPPRAVRRGDRGFVTAEAALAVPAIVAVLAMLLWGVGVGLARQECADAARGGARALARGETPEAARELALAIAPRGAEVEFSHDGELHRVVVAARSPGPDGLALTVAARASAHVEPT